MNSQIRKSVLINASLKKVWDHLTKPELMVKWMGEVEMGLEIHTDWIVGNAMVIKGFHHVKFENKGFVLQFAPHKIIQYSHLSSVSRLPDLLENYSIITFLLTPHEDFVSLTITAGNFPTETIYKHLDFYWQGTITIMKNIIEKQ